MIKIKTILHWGGACPFQLDALTDDNRLIYGRYRHGFLSVRIGQPDDLGENAGVCGEQIFGEKEGGCYDGVISLEEFQEATKGAIDWPK